MVTCSVDKSINFQTAEQTATGPEFSRRHCVVEKTSLYDMDCSGSQVLVACQDRNVRVYGVDSGKMRRCLKGSGSDKGSLLKVRMDPSGSLFATSCSNKNIDVFDLETGECVASMFGHSETVTSLRFSPDCRRLFSASGDSCIFVWRLDDHMTNTMSRKLPLRPAHRRPGIRRETFITAPAALLPPAEEEEETERRTPVRLDTADDPLLLQTNGKLPLWFRKLQAEGGACPLNQLEPAPPQPQCRWSKRATPLVVCSTESDQEEEEEEDFHPQSLEHLLGEPETVGELGSTFMVCGDSTCTGVDRCFSIDDTTQTQSQLEAAGQGAEPVWSTQLSPDSACSEGSAGSLDQHHDPDTDSLSQSSSAGSLSPEEDEDGNRLKDLLHRPSSLSEERFDTDLTALQPPEEKPFLNPRLSISTRFLSRFQDRVRAWPVRAPPSIPNRIAEESHGSCMTVKSERSGAGPAAWTRTGSSRADATSGSHNISTSSVDPANVDLNPGVHLEPPLQADLTPSSAAPQPPEAQLAAGPDLQLPNTEAPPAQSSRLQVEATPPQVSSQDSSTEETLTNQNQTVIQRTVLPAPPITSTETRVLPGPGDPVLPGNTGSSPLVPPLCTSSPLLEMLHPHETDTCQSAPPAEPSEVSTGEPGVLFPSPASHNQEVCMQHCQHVTAHLQQAAAHLQHAVHLYQQLESSQHGGLQEALSIIQSHLQGALPPLTRRNCSAPSVLLEEGGAITRL
ncbi:WD repeat-containing protein 62 [Oryzias melastigma]|uniref:WD repeat-containing protein 62 n=1 Tax=Oryzias melastigma TaxID=30732 RepID=UPI000CF7F341|nr:WD repeat-containing protein 62 [Oryzias melastigma]